MSMFCKMPEVMLEQILSSLPPKTLMRFKCISKWWYAFINNPKFVAKHLSNSMHNNLSTCVVLNRSVVKDTKDPKTNEIELVFSLLNFCNGNNDGEPGFLSCADDMKIPLSTRSDSDSLRVIGYWSEVMGGNPGERVFVPCDEVWVGNPHECVFDPSVEAPPGFSVSIKSRSDLPRIIGHCNGIICLANPSDLLAYPSHVFLWNPAIQEFKLLPPEPYLRNWPKGGNWSPQPDWPQDVYYLPIHQFTDALGFGYDSKSKDYKVVNMGFNGSDLVQGDDHVIIYPPKAVVYTLSSDSWKEIKTDSLETETTNLWPESFQLYFNGMCYWLGHEQHKEVNVFDLPDEYKEFIRYVIILFDTSNEVFHDILLPDTLCDSLRVYCYDMHLLVWNESVALLGMCNIGSQADPISFGIWVMNEFSGGKGVWTKHITFDLTERPLTFWKSDEILMIPKKSSGRRIFSYNFSTQMRKDLPFQSVPECFATAINYVKSIVSIKGDNKLESREF